MENILKKLKKKVLVYDGAMGTMLQEAGLQPGQLPEEWNLSCPDKIIQIHEAYIAAGADVIETNTFGGNRRNLEKYGFGGKCKEINYQGVKLAKQASQGKAYVAASVGPLPEMVAPLGKLSFHETFELYKQQISALAAAKPDLILLETFSDIKELKIAVMAAREVCSLPIQAQLTYSASGTTISGTPPEVAAAVLEPLQVEIIGANCSLGPEGLLSIVQRLSRSVGSEIFLSILPNAGLPEIVAGKTFYRATPQELARFSKKFVQLGVNLIGGCCGTRPEHIKAIAKAVKNNKVKKRKSVKRYLRLASRTQVLEMVPGKGLYVIGERINPSRRKALQEEFRKTKTALVKEEAMQQVNNGAHLLDVNVGMPGIKESEVIRKVVNAVQQVVAVPLVIDSNNPETLAAGLEECIGRPLINSVNGEKEKMCQILPLAKKYGAGIIALCIDDKGIPETAAARINVAKKISKEANKFKLKQEDIVVDLLTLAAGAQKGSARVTLAALRQADTLGWQTSLGISNVSFGLPDRSAVNSAFLTMALQEGLTAAIINPAATRVQETLLAWTLLKGEESSFAAREVEAIPVLFENKIEQKLYESVLLGDKDNIKQYLETCLGQNDDPLRINQQILIPALEEVGRLYDKKEYFLPQLLLAAETMQKAVNILEKKLPATYREGKAKVLMATVKGDLHDIGKNIVCAVLKNYGLQVIDLGKDVSVAEIINTARKNKVDIIGLSSLMTTTMGQMEIVINELKKKSLDIPTIVGGAVVSETYAKNIGAAAYAKDAVAAVNVIKNILQSNSQNEL